MARPRSRGKELDSITNLTNAGISVSIRSSFLSEKMKGHTVSLTLLGKILGIIDL
jgi:hypothetical protein